MEPFEAKIFNISLALILMTALYSTYTFLPAQLYRIADWLIFQNSTALD
jgi:hypothetical protein